MALDALSVAVAALAIGYGLSPEQADHVHRRLLEDRTQILADMSAGDMIHLLLRYIAEVRPPVVAPRLTVAVPEPGWRCQEPTCDATGTTTAAAEFHHADTGHAINQDIPLGPGQVT